MTRLQDFKEKHFDPLDFTTAMQTANHLNNIGSLADWLRKEECEMYKSNHDTFTVKKYLMDYVKLQKMMETEMEIEELKPKNEIIQFQDAVAAGKPKDRKSIVRMVFRKSVVDSTNNDEGGRDTPAVAQIKPLDRRKTNILLNSNATDTSKTPTEGSNRRAAKPISEADTVPRHKTTYEILSSPTTNPWLYFKEECVQMLKKGGIERSKEEILILTRVFKNLKAMEPFSQFVLKEVASTVEYVSIDKDRVVFKQGKYLLQAVNST
jgi:hypothetical protein